MQTTTPTNAEDPYYYIWLPAWTKVIATPPLKVNLPLSAYHISTPLDVSSWMYHLSSYPNQDLVQFFQQGISQGFRIGYQLTSPLHSAKRNLEGAYLHPKVVEEYLQAEVDHGRLAGPYSPSLLPQVHINRFGVIPKRHQPGKWRLIVDLSYPKGHSVNDGILRSLCELHYITIDDAIQKIVQMGQGSLLAKIDIQSAFRLLPIHPTDRPLLAMRWKQGLYIDTCLPFGLRSAPKLFNILADLLSWIISKRGASFLLHYLDDFLTIGPPNSDICKTNLNIITRTCEELGVPLALEKIEGPATSLPFLGIILDSHKMEARLPLDKLMRIRNELTSWQGKKKATKRQILSLVGSLHHAAKVVYYGRAFVSRMYATAAKVKELDYFTRLNMDFRSDLLWWHTFITTWNGHSLLRWHTLQHPITTAIQTDASGALGCGAVFGNLWLQWKWPPEWQPLGIMAKELVPIVFSCAVWGPQLARQSVLFQCDNLSLVIALNKGSCKDKLVMQLLRILTFFVAHFDMHITSTHIAGTLNVSADHLSRFEMSSFFSLNPQATRQSTTLPQPLLQLLAATGPDWTSPLFRKLFNDILAMV